MCRPQGVGGIVPLNNFCPRRGSDARQTATHVSLHCPRSLVAGSLGRQNPSVRSPQGSSKTNCRLPHPMKLGCFSTVPNNNQIQMHLSCWVVIPTEHDSRHTLTIRTNPQYAHSRSIKRITPAFDRLPTRMTTGRWLS